MNLHKLYEKLGGEQKVIERILDASIENDTEDVDELVLILYPEYESVIDQNEFKRIVESSIRNIAGTHTLDESCPCHESEEDDSYESDDPQYELTYDTDYDDNIKETFRGSWLDLQKYIRELKSNGCYNIDAAAVGNPDEYEECNCQHRNESCQYRNESRCMKRKKKSHRKTESVVYNVSFKKNDTYQARLVRANTEDEVSSYFSTKEPSAEVYGIKVATKDDMKPGKPLVDVTDSKLVKSQGRRVTEASSSDIQEIKKFWVYKELVDRGYIIDISDKNVVIKFDDEDVYARFQLDKFDEDLDGYPIYEVNLFGKQLINDEVDFYHSYVDAVESCLYYFYSRY